MNGTFTIPKYVTSVLSELAATKEKLRRLVLTNDIDGHMKVLDALRAIQEPTDEERKLIDTLEKTEIPKVAMKEDLISKINSTMVKFGQACNKWLSGQVVFDNRGYGYMLIKEVVGSDGKDKCGYKKIHDMDLYINGIFILPDAVSISHTINESSQIQIADACILDNSDPVSSFSRILSRFKSCDIAEVIDALERRKVKCNKFYDDVIEKIQSTAKDTKRKNKLQRGTCHGS